MVEVLINDANLFCEPFFRKTFFTFPNKYFLWLDTDTHTHTHTHTHPHTHTHTHRDTHTHTHTHTQTHTHTHTPRLAETVQLSVLFLASCTIMAHHLAVCVVV